MFTVAHLVKKLHRFHRIRRYVTVFTTFTPTSTQPITDRSSLVVSSHLRQCQRKSVFPSGFHSWPPFLISSFQQSLVNTFTKLLITLVETYSSHFDSFVITSTLCSRTSQISTHTAYNTSKLIRLHVFNL